MRRQQWEPEPLAKGCVISHWVQVERFLSHQRDLGWIKIMHYMRLHMQMDTII